MKKKRELELPEIDVIEKVLSKRKYRLKYWNVMKNTIIVMLTATAVIVLITMLLMPVLRIYGKSMTPTLESGDIVLSFRYADCTRGDIISFYYNNKVLVKRVIAVSGDIVEMDDDGNVYVNEKKIEEPYVSNPEKGECDIEFPYTVPDAHYFVLGDCRNNSTDSRSSEIGCIDEERILGKIVFRIFPLNKFGITE